MNDGGVVGSFAISKAGHDKGEVYVIVGVAGDNFVLVANGENRQVSKPKRKNVRHLFVTKSKVSAAATADLEIKRAIKLYKKENV